jgi:hypothetical protein
MFDNILARLGIDGTIKKVASPQAAGANKVVTTDYTGKISPTLVSAGTVDSVTAEQVTYTVNNDLPTTDNLQKLLEAFEDRYLHVANQLSEFTGNNAILAFNNIKQAAGVGTGWTNAGVVFQAAYNTSTDTVTTSDNHVVPYVVTPAVANNRYLIKNAGTSDTPVDPGAQITYGYVGYTTALSAGLGTSTAANARTLVSREYVDSTVAAGLGVTTVGTVWLHPDGSNTGSTNIFKFTSPYGSLKAAKNAIIDYRAGNSEWATKLITVMVMPGTYTAGSATYDVALDHLRIHFMPGAKMTCSDSASDPLFKLDGLTNFAVTGYGEFVDNNSNSGNGILRCNGSGTSSNANVYFECQSITAAYGNAIYLENYNNLAADAFLNVNVKIHGNVINTNSGLPAIYLGGQLASNIQIDGNLISAQTGITIGKSATGGLAGAYHTIKANTINCVGTAVDFYTASSNSGVEVATTIIANVLKTSGGASTIKTADVAGTTGKLNIIAENIYSGSGKCVETYDGIVSISNATLNSPSGNAIYLNSTNVVLTLKGLNIITTSQASSIGAGATTTVKLIGTTRANYAASNYVSFSGGFFDVALN